ncbi:MAG: hypothetical protein GWN18_03245, partial [Thermoplasmata archaeon]|nr:hypothetical protein [Thermoplasmata archaeon]NIS14602.1 hypothetical protein [Thermoplasmata archaeon]NIS18973.1 hypothetical protein [Thermoplasmata archaeon]NIT80349.1 hypothetical protein [Thermoplasmata archaeon]NIU48123.1 hypothetical protein [Thermoplasmata archaeon]
MTVLLNGDVLDTIVLGEEGTFMVSLTLVEGENTITAFATDRALN